MTTLLLEPSRPSVSSSCDRHPDQPVTGFCADCLRERLAGLEEPHRKSTSSAAAGGNPLRAIFRTGNNKPSSSSTSSSFLPELRRCKSFSAPKAEAFFSGLFEPQRKSCDVRGRNTLYSLFHLDNENRPGRQPWGGEIEVNLPEPEIRVSEPLVVEEFHEIQEAEEEIEEEERGGRGVEALREVEQEEEVEEAKTIKDHIDLDAMRKTDKAEKEKKDFKEIAGSFWVAASDFSKKFQKWRRKQKMKKARDKCSASIAAEAGKNASFSRRFRDTQSEVADYGFGRRSCDTDPRFSLDAGRISFDDPRFSFDEPRASWDGFLTGGRVQRFPPMLSVLEDPPAPPVVPRPDMQIPVEEPRHSLSVSEDPAEAPGGTAQTREYYSDSSSSSRRRKNLERSGSIKKATEIDETKPVFPNSKVIPTSTDYNYISGCKLGSLAAAGGDRELKDSNSNSNSNSLRDDCWESFDSVYQDGAAAQPKNGKKSRRWGMSWSIWGLIHRRSKDEEDDTKSCRAPSVIDRSFSESWPELRREVNGELRGGIDRRVFRCNSSISSRGSLGNGIGPAFGSGRRGEGNGVQGRKKEEIMLERNRSARYSPSHFDNGLLRFYLTPLRGSSRRNGFGVSGKLKSKSSHSFARSMLRLY